MTSRQKIALVLCAAFVSVGELVLDHGGHTLSDWNRSKAIVILALLVVGGVKLIARSRRP